MCRSRQSYYKALKSQQKKLLESDKLKKMVDSIRQIMPRIGGKKLHYMLRAEMTESALKIGRDRFFEWLKENNQLIYPKRMHIHTTQSNHRFWIHQNLIQEVVPTQPNQLWVSDITYIRTREGFCFLALITDAYSRKIVGYDVSDSLELEGCLRALKSALQTASNLNQLIHHSDRGVQYCANQYTDLLKENGITISMAEKGNCYQNALAERVNGILKNEFNLDYNFRTKQLAYQTVRQSIYIYNQHRPHWGINLLTPQQKHAA